MLSCFFFRKMKPPIGQEDAMRIITLLFVILLVVLGAFFSALNSESVKVNYLFGNAELPLAVIVFIALGIGILLTALSLGFRVFWLKLKNKRLNSKLKQLEANVHQQSQQELIREIK